MASYIKMKETASARYYQLIEACVESEAESEIKNQSDLAGTKSRSGRRIKMQELENQIEKLAQGDREAMAAIYERTKSGVYGLALSIVRNAPDAEDVMQDTYIRVYEGSANYRPEGKPMAWILRIARNLALDIVRSPSAANLTLEEEWLPDNKSDFSESSLDKMVLEMLLMQLDQDEREIVMLHSIERFKHREIAEILGIPLGTALSKYHRSLAKLRKNLREKVK